METDPLMTPMPGLAHIVDAECVEVYDGDTVTVLIDPVRPLSTVLPTPVAATRSYGGRVPLRLRDVAALEVRNTDGQAFKDAGLRTRDLLRATLPPGTRLRVWPSSLETLGRPLAGLWRVADGLDVCGWLRTLPTVTGWQAYQDLKAQAPGKAAWRAHVEREIPALASAAPAPLP